MSAGDDLAVAGDKFIDAQGRVVAENCVAGNADVIGPFQQYEVRQPVYPQDVTVQARQGNNRFPEMPALTTA
jgi:hypothetical protein